MVVPHYVSPKATERLKKVISASNALNNIPTSFHPLKFDKYEKIVVVTGRKDNDFFMTKPVKDFFGRIARRLNVESQNQLSGKVLDVEKNSLHLLEQERIDDDAILEAEEIFPDDKNPFSIIKAQKLLFDEQDEDGGGKSFAVRVKDNVYFPDLGDINLETGEIRMVTTEADKKDAQSLLDRFALEDIENALRGELKPLEEWDFPLPKHINNDVGAYVEISDFSDIKNRIN